MDVSGTIQAAAFQLNGKIITRWPSGGTGDGHSLDAADGSPKDASYVDNNGNIGIGTTTPGGTLHIFNNNPSVDKTIYAVTNHAAAGTKYGGVHQLVRI